MLIVDIVYNIKDGELDLDSPVDLRGDNLDKERRADDERVINEARKEKGSAP